MLNKMILILAAVSEVFAQWTFSIFTSMQYLVLSCCLILKTGIDTELGTGND